jgi:uncharacterized protein YukE
MMPIITVTIVVLTGAAKKLGAAGIAGKILSTVGSMASITSLSMNFWRNSDADEFRMRMDELEKDLREMQQVMEEYCKCLEQSAKDYEQTQQAVRNKAASLPRPRA